MKRATLIMIISGACALILSLVLVLPRLSDRTSPRLYIRNVQENGSYRENFQIELEAADEAGKLREYTVLLDGEILFHQRLDVKSLLRTETVTLTNLANGTYRLEVTVRDNAWPANLARKVFTLHYDTTPPKLVCRTADLSLPQGGVLALDITSPGERSLALLAVYKENPLPAYPLRMWPGIYRVLIPAGAMEKISGEPVQLSAVDAAGNTASAVFNINVRRWFFPSEEIVLDTSKSGLLTDADASRRNRERLAEALSETTGEKLWEGKFLHPTEGVISSQFGTRRVYNGGLIYSYHKGLDLANAQGTPIYAANKGRVVLAEELPLYGNSVVIDHGLGVFSQYYHMHQLLARAGTLVEKGEQLGIMGTTGISTGPHLHWEMKISGVSVNPLQWEEREF